jgi:hypothetical protein
MAQLSFGGSLEGPTTPSVLVERVTRALRSERGRNIAISQTYIEFDGLTGYMSTSPLTNIGHGKINFNDQSNPPSITYFIQLERWPFLISGGLSILASTATILGLGDFKAFAAFGAIAFVVVLANSFVVRYRFHRWLDAKLHEG